MTSTCAHVLSFLLLPHVLVCVRQALDIPDALLLLEETEGAPDPLFGVMQDAWLSPSTFTKVPRSETPDCRKQVGETRHEILSKTIRLS